ncbi:hypothetical protein QYQ99_17800 [Comamonas testosteroni]|uniref:hypothetical protein n=1 Tax=Comamonas testosteroni TaxID=285 RepID=UPI00265E9EBF|nr:hypothetical protein [Comamonas testosteroni]WKL14262.1 hypothetical protein QYQ99_17800 [Comamonas testosteroni]
MSKLSRAIGLTAIFAAILFNPVFAQKSKKPPKVWAQEPTSVLGIKLGVPLVDLALAECESYSSIPPQDAPCTVKDKYNLQKGRFENLIGMPNIGVDYSTTLNLHNGLVRSLTLKLDHRDYLKLRSILEERYGAPTQVERGTVTSGAGAVLNSDTLTWTGKRITLLLLERAVTVDSTYVTFTDESVMAAEIESQTQKSKDAASKF